MNKFIKKKVDTIINGVDTPSGRLFDIILIISIAISSTFIIIDSIPQIHIYYGHILAKIQSMFLIIFTVEYIFRLFVSESKKKYIFSFYGLIDLFAILPIYLSFIFNFGTYFPIIRVLRLLRLFSVFKMGRYIDESGALLRALKASKAKITVFIFTIIFIIIIVGAIMYTIEGPQNGFVSIPESMYWAVVTISTVGYGDISPQTPGGKFISSCLMIVGYGIIAVPTGIITSELNKDNFKKEFHKINVCPNCGETKHLENSLFCHKCGNSLA